MTENTETTYNGGGLKGPLYWLAGVVTGKLALSAMQGGGLLGGGNAATQAANAAVQYELAKKDSEIALLKAGQETDAKLVEVYTELRKQDKTQDAISANIDKRLAALETAAPLREQIVLGRVNEVASMAQSGIATNSCAIQSLANTVNSLTKVVVPNENVSPGWGVACVHPAGPRYFPPMPPTPATQTGGATPA